MSTLFGDAAGLTHTRFARVVVERGIEHAPGDDAGLTYACPDPVPAVGERVEVPLGRRNTKAAGIVVRVGGRELLDGLDPERVKAILRRTGTSIPASLISLGEWIASYYVCPTGMVFGSMLPAAVKRGTGSKVVVEVRPAEPLAHDDDPRLAGLSTRLRKAWMLVAAIEPERFPLTVKAIVSSTPGVSPAAIKRFIQAGVLSLTSRETVLAQNSSAGPTTGGHADSPTAPPTLTSEQTKIVEGIGSTLGAFAPHLIRGVTGSGKTEVYLRLVEALFKTDPGAGAIILVPEIALTPQTSRRFLDRFPGQVAVLHSGLTAAQRHHQWAACAAGRVRLVVGARSAVFAPFGRLGLVVVDEEHDSSYKQDQLPRYHARDVAVKRAQLEMCPIVLGSATPSLESWANTQKEDNGTRAKYRLWTMARRANNAPLPRVEIVDLAEERRRRAAQPGAEFDHHLHLLGPHLEGALDRTLAEGGQALLLLNRRGFANYICCVSGKCGWTMRCDRCDATSVYHLYQRIGGGSGGFVRCHHCLAEQKLPRQCPLCGNRVNTFGLGTQRVEQELERKFAVTRGLQIGETLLRIDSDTMGTARDYFDALDRFAAGRVRVLLGTQMIAKGLDFPNVRLVGIVNADTAINLPDFRAAERTFQLVCQVAGRAGRGSTPGLVIVQTMNPSERAIVLAAKHDFEAFAAEELAVRHQAGLPPIGRMARIVCRDEDLADARRGAEDIAAALRDAIEQLPGRDAVRLRGPFPCPVARVAGQHRVSIELQSSSRSHIQRVLGEVRAQGLLKSDAHTAVDIDPIALL